MGISTAKVDGFVLTVTISVLGKSKGYSLMSYLQLLQGQNSVFNLLFIITIVSGILERMCSSKTIMGRLTVSK